LKVAIADIPFFSAGQYECGPCLSSRYHDRDIMIVHKIASVNTFDNLIN
jgi:hypothetical protein